MRIFALALYLIPSLAMAIGPGPHWPTADIPRFWILGEGNYHFTVDGTFFHSKENYDFEGQVNQPTNFDHIRYGQIKYHGAFGFTPRVSVFAQAEARGVFVSNATASNISDDENYGFGDAFLAFRWLFLRTSATNRVYPSEWSPKTIVALFEGSWNFPMYARAKSGKPPLGDQSNDLTAMLRSAWYANEWLALSAGVGYSHRTSNYSTIIPWNVRADFLLTKLRTWRLWLELLAYENTQENTVSALNPHQPDPIPGGSLLYKSQSPTIRFVNFGVGYLFSRRWEATLAGVITSSGINYAKGYGATLGITWRPYQVPELRYDDFRKEQLERLAQERTQYRQRSVVAFSFSATVLKVSSNRNFFKISVGGKNTVQRGDPFFVYEPDDLSGKPRRALAYATVEAVRGESAYLKIQQRFMRDIPLAPGYEARRVIFSE
ncbi:MAG: hypothetical protein M9962_03200 [Oligoflexia bacterium]|nr:hypothetical protein [Oligoflexia bacterium]